MTEALILAGADVVKVGIGPGAQCSTRRVAGVGVPQLSAVIECSDAAHGLKGLICSDGGIVYPGDLGKAFGAGADFVMMGSVLGGHKESGGDIYQNGQLISRDSLEVDLNDPMPTVKMKIYGMASAEAMDRHYGGKSDYKAAEGRVSYVPYKGTVSHTVEEFLGGLRSTMSYIGAEKLKEISKRTTFIRTNRILNQSTSS
jgi:GMP reductase